MSALSFTGRWVSGAAVALCLLGTLLVASPARAEIPPILRPGTRPWFVQANLGSAINISDTATQFKLTQEVGYHFSGNAKGPALGGFIWEAFGSGFVQVAVGPKFWWDIQIIDQLGLYVTPFAGVGYSYLGSFGGQSYFHFHLGVVAKLMLGDRGFVMIQPLAFDVNVNGNFVPVRYDFLVGGGFAF